MSGLEVMMKGLEAVKDFLFDLSKIERDEKERSFTLYKASETVGKAIQELGKQIPKEIEVEGGGSTWWFACPECHGAIDNGDAFCRHCGQKVKAK